jgi:hypothetical protein
MSVLIGLRAFNRSQRFDIGGKSLSPSSTALVNIDNKRVQRDLGRHSAIGAFFQTTPPIFQNDDGVVNQGGKVTTRATTLVLDISPVYATRASGATVSHVADTVTLTAADATNPRIDTIALNTSSADIVKIDGTATAGANLFNLTGKGTVPANRIVLAYVLVPATATALTQTNVIDARP